MLNFLKTNLGLLLLIFSVATAQIKLSAQLPTYTLDEDFTTGDLFRTSISVTDFHFLENNQTLVGGTYFAAEGNPSGLDMINEDGSADNSWGPDQPYDFRVIKIIAQEDGYVYPFIYSFSKVNLDGIPWLNATGNRFSDYIDSGNADPYTVERVWDIFQQENGDLLLAGAISNDTLNPGVFRGVTRLHADGSHDTTFPEIHVNPNNSYSAVRAIFPAPNGYWYISGGFTGINGHETNHIARLTPEFEVDTSYVSPFMYDGFVGYTEEIILVDSQSRAWVTGYAMRLQEAPTDTIQIVRLLPNGTVDESFLPRYMESNYPEGWVPKPTVAIDARELDAHPGNYLINGQFSHFEGTEQPCIAVVNDAGVIQDHFFQGQGATVNDVYEDEEYPYVPSIYVVKELDNGSLMVGGSFSEFMGETQYSIVRLNPGFLSTDDQIERGELKLYPNPVRNFVQMELPTINERINRIEVSDLHGRVVQHDIPVHANGFSVSELIQGLYVVKAYTETTIYTQKMIVKN